MIEHLKEYVQSKQPTEAEAGRLKRRFQQARWPGRRPSPSRRALMPAIALTFTLAIALFIVVMAPGSEETDTRSVSQMAGPPVVNLQMLREQGLREASSGGHLSVDERLLFRISSDQNVALVVWVVGPRGQETITRQPVWVDAGHPADLRLDNGLLYYRLHEAGRYRFYVSTKMGQCHSPDCMMKTLEVR